MARVAACNDCGARFKVPDSTKAAKAKCPKCGGVVAIPAGDGGAAPTAPAKAKPKAPAQAAARPQAAAPATKAAAPVSGKKAAVGAKRSGAGARKAAGGASKRGGKSARGKSRGGDKKEGNTGAIVGIVAVVILLAGAGWWFMRDDGSATTSGGEGAAATGSTSNASTSGDSTAAAADPASPGDDAPAAAGTPAPAATGTPDPVAAAPAAAPATDAAGSGGTGGGGLSALDSLTSAAATAGDADQAAPVQQAPAASNSGSVSDSEPLPTVIEFEPFGPVPGTTEEQLAEWSSMVMELYITDGGAIGRSRKRLKEALEEVDVVDAIPAYVNAMNGLDLKDPDVVRTVFVLVRDWQERVNSTPRFFFDGETSKREIIDQNKRVKVINGWIDWWKTYADGSGDLEAYRSKMEGRG